MLIGLAVLRLPIPKSHPYDKTIVKLVPPAVSAPNRTPAARIIIERIQTDPTIASRLAIPRTPPHWQRLDDDHFLGELAKAGKPAGLVKVSGREMLVFHRPSP
jgi:hypothetical protein